MAVEEGVNKLGFTQRGMLFLMYNTNLQDVNAKPVKIHIPLGSGYVSGFFDVKTDKTNDKYKELINKATYKYFCIRGLHIVAGLFFTDALNRQTLSMGVTYQHND
mgnify:CR=1 FL=1